MFSAAFCTFEPFKVQLKTWSSGVAKTGGLICAIGCDSWGDRRASSRTAAEIAAEYRPGGEAIRTSGSFSGSDEWSRQSIASTGIDAPRNWRIRGPLDRRGGESCVRVGASIYG